MTISDYTGVVGAFAVILMLLWLALQFMKRFQAGAADGGTGVPVRLIKRVGVGPKQGVGLLQVGDRVLVVSMGEGGTRLLTELEDNDLIEALSTAPPRVSNRRAPASRFLKRIIPMLLVALMVTAVTAPVFAQAPTGTPGSGIGTLPGIGPQVNVTVGQGDDEIRLTGAVGLVVFIGFLTLLPALLLLMTSFTRILVVMQFLRPALGTQNSPPVQLLVALSVLLTGVVMQPTLQEVNTKAIQPYMRGEITQPQAYDLGIRPFREFMLRNTDEKDLALFTDLSGVQDDIQTFEDISTFTMASAFVTSELRTAFQMGFLIFVPFIVVDLIVASVLMSLGMFMLPPMMVSLPFKLLLFVLADGWMLVVKNLVFSFA